MLYDDIMESVLSNGETPSVERFGGLDGMLPDAKLIGASLFPDVFVELVLPFRAEREAEVDGFLLEILSVIERGPELNTISNWLLAIDLHDGSWGNRVFRRLLSLSTEREKPTPLRNAALKGALAFAREDAIRLARLIAELAETPPDDDPGYIAHAARIAGVVLAKTSNPALLDFLHVVRDVAGASDQVHFELGLVSLKQAIEAQDTASVLEHLKDARRSLDEAAQLRESRYDARLYGTCIDILLGFHDRGTPGNLEALLKAMREDAFAYSEYSLAGRSDPILGSIASQVAALTSLAAALSKLIEEIEEDVWLNAIQVIEEHLIFAYEANRSIFAAQPGRGLDCVIRPVLEPKIFGNRNHLRHIAAWMSRHSEKFDADLTADLRAAIELAYERGPDFPSDAESGGPLDSALLERVRSIDSDAYQNLVGAALQNSYAQQVANASPAIGRVLETVDRDFAKLKDYLSPAARRDFLTLVLAVANFLARKLDSSVEQDRFSAYLFKHDTPLPIEKDLQQDFLRHGQSAGLPVDDEVKGVGGGRADIRYKSNRHTMIIEVKRELADSSFDNLLTSYGEQTAIYQATNVKLGVMLVLDLSKDNSRLAHMDTWYETRIGDLLGDGTERGVLIIKVPGRRGTPSAATVAAKKKKAASKKLRSAGT
ncbi:hypothetical protein [Rhizobium leguminosarum]|uniref:hypothetical protein n=1 Tax=Rhizobium leguminosarum TaxID=384 RepID=UPI00103AB7A5|nr:hypothetical protein [Rhizobium leguminosarum]TBY27434.1 hypothetical protein E0H55_27480 [Rhizobium leguminosarum bv. viciae]